MALELGLECGGWCPRGRRAEDGRIAECYPLRETPTAHYAERTDWNVRDSDGTLILTIGDPRGGTALTASRAARRRRPHLIVDLDADTGPAVRRARGWIVENAIRALNVAGPRESQRPGIYSRAAAFLRRLLREAGRMPSPPRRSADAAGSA